ncbi:hypothetical protein DSM104443_01319 [Usitatibacter rugosus]|uniref:Uncharacterized protein n=1 Tax=Usitatibacter rugosus TaxID=2732067 RepID=A0A6M4GTB0_9PROT|nr:hypothetical protein [Usitatibacter rugosus]QJR10265.1 hypothetical protein DSM104443_01319 [Usitatibacter rugosus]
MAAADVYRKTERGQAEIASRKLKLSPRLRTMLILIDGTQPELLVKEEGEKVGAPEDFLDQLVEMGLVEKAGRAAIPAAAGEAPIAPLANEFERFRAAKDLMNVTIVDALGLKSFFFTMKLERAGTIADLRALAEPYRQAIAKADGEAAADVLARHLNEMLR